MINIKKYLQIILTLTVLFMFSTPAFAGDVYANELTLKDAIKKAFANSVMLKNDEIDIDTNEINRDNAEQAMDYTPINYNYNPKDTSIFKQFYGADFAYRNAEKKLVSDKRQLIIDVTTNYNNVILCQNALELAKLNLNKDYIKLSQVRAKLDVGISTTAELLAAEAQVAVDNASIKEAEVNLNNAYNKLNKIIGEKTDTRFKLVDAIEYLPEDLDSGTEILKAMNNSYISWSAEESAKYYKQIKYFEYWSDIGLNNEAQYANKAKDAKEEIKLSAAALCNGLTTTENRINQLDKQIKQLEENIRVLKLQEQVGLVTKDIVLGVQTSLKQLENSRMELVSRYNVSLKTLKNLTGELNTDVK